MFSNEPPANAIFQIPIDFDEINELMRLIGLNDDDESQPIGNIRLTATGGKRYWHTTDSYRLGRITGLDDPNEFDLLLPPRIFNRAHLLRSTTNDYVLYLNEFDDGSRYFTLRGDLGEILGPYPRGPFPQIDELMLGIDGRTPDFTVNAELLAEAVSSTGYGWDTLPKIDDTDVPLIEFARSNEGLWMSSRWNAGMPTTVLLAGPTPQRTIQSSVNASYLLSILRRIEGDVDIAFGPESSDPISFTDGTFTGVLMPIRRGLERHRPHVESVISDVFGPEALTQDEIGDYQIRATGVPVWGRMIDVQPPTLRVLATVAAEIENSPELLHEINEINTNLTFAKVDWDNNFVTVSSDLVAETLDAEELDTAYSRVRQIAVEMSEVIIAMFGGRGVNSDAERWNAYRNTIVAAELYPEQKLFLNGPNAIEDWPFINDVFVITAHNPLGIQRSPEDNRKANRELATEIIRCGGRYCAAVGESRDGNYGEPGFVVWNLSMDDAVYLGRRFRQEAIFMASAEEFHLVDMRDGSIELISSRRD